MSEQSISRLDINAELLAACVAAYDWIAAHGDSLPPSAMTLANQLDAAIALAEGKDRP